MLISDVILIMMFTFSICFQARNFSGQLHSKKNVADVSVSGVLYDCNMILCTLCIRLSNHIT